MQRKGLHNALEERKKKRKTKSQWNQERKRDIPRMGKPTGPKKKTEAEIEQELIEELEKTGKYVPCKEFFFLNYLLCMRIQRKNKLCIINASRSFPIYSTLS